VQQPSLRALLHQKSVLTGATVLVAAGILIYAVLFRKSPGARAGHHRSELQDLVAAVGPRRTFEPRVTGNFAYGELTVPAVTRSADRAKDDAPLPLRVAAIELEKRARGSADPAALNAFGIAQLMSGDTARAVSTLEEASRLAPKDARLSSDLAAGYLVRAHEANQIEDVARAVGFAHRATEADPRLAEARFNLALALEGLSLRHEATRAWQAYVEIDPASPWAADAKRRIERLRETAEARWEKQRREVIAAGDRGDEASIRAATRTFPDTAYDYVENDLIPAWADAWLARDVEKAGTRVRLARAFGQALADGVGDRMPLDAAIAIERATASRERADALARGHQVFREGRALYEHDRVADSETRFTEARSRLLDLQSPFAEWAALQLAIAHYYRGNHEQSTRLLDGLLDVSPRSSHLRVLGRTYWMKGLLHSVRGQVGEALDFYNDALAIFVRAEAVVDQAAMHSNLADSLEAVGDLRGAWTHEQSALGQLNALNIPRRREAILSSAARLARRRNHSDATVFFQNEFIADAQRTALPIAAVQGHLDRAESHASTGQFDLADGDVRDAEAWLSRISDEALAKRLRAEVMLAKGQVLQRRSPEQSIEILRASRQYFSDARMTLRLPRVDLALGRAQLAAGQREAAEATFLDGIRALEAQRARLPGGQLRLGYFEQPWNLFDEMIGLQAANAASLPAALAFAERFRARDLAETASEPARRAHVVNPASLAEQIPPDVAILYYACLDDRLLTWVIRARGVDSFQQQLASNVLAEHVASFNDALRNGDARGMDEGGKRLYEHLIRPLAASLQPESTLAIVPDGVLNGVAFAALKNPQSGRYLIEDHPVHIAPSATMFEIASNRRRATSPTARTSLVVLANPRLDPEDAASLPDLSSAEAEARDLAALYPGSTVLIGQRATKGAFVDAAARHRIVHFAGHALANEQYSLLSRLLLARDGPGRSGSLFAHEILELKLPATDLVVLAGCRTGVGAIRKGEGVISLARPFLALGVPSVIATLWDVNDAASRALFGTFYQSLRHGAEPVIALRDAQLRLLRDRDAALQSPAAWAPFTSLGGLRLNGGQ
jgi:CHAT domain-containing protein